MLTILIAGFGFAAGLSVPVKNWEIIQPAAPIPRMRKSQLSRVPVGRGTSLSTGSVIAGSFFTGGLPGGRLR